MLDIKLIRENPDLIKDICRKKKVKVDLDKLLQLDQKRRENLKELEKLRAKRNKGTALIARNKTERLLKEAREIKKRILEVEKRYTEDDEQEYQALLLSIPNLILSDVPEGRDETENKVLRKQGKLPEFDFKPKDHIILGEALDIIDTKRAAKVSGARFGYLKGGAALLEIGLIQLVFNVLTDQAIIKKIANSVRKGYSSKVFVPIFPPMIIKPEVFAKMARLSPEDKDDRYYLEKDNLYLIGSAEHTLGAMHMNETIPEQDLPLRYLGFSTSFRREAGSYGKDTKGILRVHQFDKLEMESFSRPENSALEQEFFVKIQEYLMKLLKLPYQVVMICTGDMGKPDAKQIDIETWLPGQDKYRETHSADLMTDYQARGLKTRVKREGGESEFLHMNDATAFAIGRIIIAIMENCQQKDGSIKVPKILQGYAGIKEIK